MSKLKLPQRQASIALFGRLTRDPELTFTQSQTATAGFSVAVDRWDGKQRVSWFANCRAFGKLAEKFADTARKGDPVYVQGEPYMEEWTTKDSGEKRKDFKVFVNSVDLLSWPEENNEPRQEPAKKSATAIDDIEIPF